MSTTTTTSGTGAAGGQRADKLAELHEQITEGVAALVDSDAWRAMLDAAARFHTYSLGNVLLIASQAPQATRVAGFRTWQSLGRQVRKGERGLAILAPCTYRPRTSTTASEGEQGKDERGGQAAPGSAKQLRGFRVVHVFDVAQTDGDPLPEVAPALLTGQAPAGLWEDLAGQLTGHGYTLQRGDCCGANGYTDPGRRVVRVRDDVDDAQAVKTLAHDLLTAPSRVGERARPARAQRTRRAASSCASASPLTAGLGSSSTWRGAAMTRAGQSYPSRDVTGLTVAALGGIRVVDALPGVAVIDAAGLPVPAIAEFLCSLLASGAATGSVRSYALALLRWWRFLAAVDVAWQQASRVEARDFVLWMRFTARPSVGSAVERGGYAATTINHNLAVLRGFYADRMAVGDGPVGNPVPAAVGRGGQQPGAHSSPMTSPERHRRAPLRQKTPVRLPRGLPDQLFDALFAAMGCDRDRALLAFYISTGARASELLGVSLDRVDVGAQRIGVHRKGSGRPEGVKRSETGSL